MTPHRDEKYLSHVRSQACCLYGGCQGPVQAHHAFGSAGGGGKGIKGSDYLAVPLCVKHHGEAHADDPAPDVLARMAMRIVDNLVGYFGHDSKTVRVVLGSAVASIAEGFAPAEQPEPTPLPAPTPQPEPVRYDAAPKAATDPVVDAAVMRVMDEGLDVGVTMFDVVKALVEGLDVGDMTVDQIVGVLHAMRCYVHRRYVEDKTFRKCWDHRNNVRGKAADGYFVAVGGDDPQFVLRKIDKGL